MMINEKICKQLHSMLNSLKIKSNRFITSNHDSYWHNIYLVYNQPVEKGMKSAYKNFGKNNKLW